MDVGLNQSVPLTNDLLPACGERKSIILLTDNSVLCLEVLTTLGLSV